MRRFPIVFFAAALSLAIAISGAAADARGAVIQDGANDANMVNNQNLTTVVTVAGNNVGVPYFAGQDTKEASYDPADLRQVTLETLYSPTPVGEDGIDYRATGFQIRMATTATPKSDGPTLIYRLNATIDGCSSFFQTFVGGPASAPTDTPSGTVQWRQLTAAACPDAATTQTNPGWTLKIDDAAKQLVMTYPYKAMSAAQRSALREGVSIHVPQAGVRTQLGVATAPQIDETAVGDSFVIGSDMPADVPCTVGCP